MWVSSWNTRNPVEVIPSWNVKKVGTDRHTKCNLSFTCKNALKVRLLISLTKTFAKLTKAARLHGENVLANKALCTTSGNVCNAVEKIKVGTGVRYSKIKLNLPLRREFQIVWRWFRSEESWFLRCLEIGLPIVVTLFEAGHRKQTVCLSGTRISPLDYGQVDRSRFEIWKRSGIRYQVLGLWSWIDFK